MTYEEHFKFFFNSNPSGFTKIEIEASRDTRPMVMYIDDDGKIQQRTSTRSWRDISVEEADLLLHNNMKLIDLQNKIKKMKEEVEEKEYEQYLRLKKKFEKE